MKPLHTFLLNKWYFDDLYRAVFVRVWENLRRARPEIVRPLRC